MNSAGALSHTAEVTDPVLNFAAESRQASLRSFAVLGPPDFVSLEKEHIPSYGKAKEQTFYHFVRGYDVSSAERVSAYIAELISEGFRSGTWYETGQWKITRVSYHTYCVMNKVDLVVSATIPGSTKVSSVNVDGEPVEVTEDLWRDAYISAACRHISNVGERPPYPCMKVYPLFMSVADEERFLAEALIAQPSWHLSGTDRAYKNDSRSTDGCADSRVAATIFDMFSSCARFEQAREMFAGRAALKHPECAVYAAKALHAINKKDESVELLQRVIDEQPESRLAVCTMLELLRGDGKYDEALAFYHAHEDVAELDSVALVHVAGVHAKCARFRDALVTLNRAEMPALTLDPFLRELMPARRSRRTPELSRERLRAADVVRTMSSLLKQERSAGHDRSLNELPARMMVSTDRMAYSVLVSMLDAISWDELLIIRSECFLMKEDLDARVAEQRTESRARVDARSERAAAATSSEQPSSAAEGEENAAVSGGSTSAGGEQARHNGAGDAAGEVEEKRAALGADGEGDARHGGGDLAGEGAPPRKPPSDGNSGDLGAAPTDVPAESLAVAGEEGEAPTSASSAEGADSDSAPAASTPNGGLAADADGDTIMQRLNELSLDEDDMQAKLELVNEIERETKKKLCQPWLDYLVTTMWEDLKCKHELDSELKKSADDEAAIVDETPLTAVDWLRRGELARRLQMPAEAMRSFEISIGVAGRAKTTALSSRLEKLEEHVAAGDVNGAVKCANDIVEVLKDRLPKVNSLAVQIVAVRAAIFRLVARFGLKVVRSAIRSAGDIADKNLHEVLFEAVNWHVYRFDE